MTVADEVVFLLDVDNTLLDPHNLSDYPPSDLAIERIGDLLNYHCSALFRRARAVAGKQETT